MPQTLVQRVARFGNKVFEPILSSRRLTRLMGREPIQIRYVGRKSGRQISLPAWAKVGPDGVLITVVSSAQKTWWRNFRSEQPIEIRLGELWRRGVAVVEHPSPGRVQVRVTWQ